MSLYGPPDFNFFKTYSKVPSKQRSLTYHTTELVHTTWLRIWQFELQAQDAGRLKNVYSLHQKIIIIEKYRRHVLQIIEVGTSRLSREEITWQYYRHKKWRSKFLIIITYRKWPIIIITYRKCRVIINYRKRRSIPIFVHMLEVLDISVITIILNRKQ